VKQILTFLQAPLFAAAFLAALTPWPLCASDAHPDLSIDWPAFLGRHDLVWEETPRQWNEGGFVGNGLLGMMVYATLDDNRIDFHLGRSDITDHRRAPDRKTSFGVPGASSLYDYPRLDVGRMVLRPAGKIQAVTMRLDLWNAELRGTVVTDLGEVRFRALTRRNLMVQMIDVESTETKTNGAVEEWRWEFRPGNPMSPRTQVLPNDKASLAYQTNPPPQLKEFGEVEVCEQPLLAGGDYATAWLEKRDTASRGTLFVSTANEIPAAGKSAEVAVSNVLEVAALPEKSLVEEHRAWRHAFFQKSFLSIPDPRLESLYWTQIYKMGAAARAEGPAVDLLGPWFRTTAWPGIWWNLNIQLTYWPYPPSNHMELSKTFVREVDAHFDGLLRRFSGKHNMGDLAWALHNYWLHFRYAGDWTALREKWLPKARRVFEDYRKLLTRGEDGKLHLSPLGSPEYKRFDTFPDTNYNLALLRWLGEAMTDIVRHTVPSHDPEEKVWEATLADLTPWPTNENGLMIGADQPLEESHRHHSHLIGFYPLFVMDPEDPDERQLIKKSLLHWHHIDGGKKLAGYSFTLAASMYAVMGMGDEANANLQRMPDDNLTMGTFHTNTFYTEAKGRNPVIETPLSAANSLIELLLQSWASKVRVFPAVPSRWNEAVFHDLRAQGAFLVSAQRVDARTAWVSVESLAGQPLTLKVADWHGPLTADGVRDFSIKETATGEYEIDLKKGERVLLRPAANHLNPVVSPVSHPPETANPFGTKKGRQLSEDQSWPETPIEGKKRKP
jgi:alpha-L-fucosidase 2